MTIAYQAMMFAREKHRNQVRKYTGNPYVDHLAEVAGIVATVDLSNMVMPHDAIAVAWLHDVVEDTSVPLVEINNRFGYVIAKGVAGLSDLEKEGNRAQRKAASRARLAGCDGWIQSIKCADLISNTSSIVQHDPKFAAVYLEEKRLLLEVMTKAHPLLLDLAWQKLREGLHVLETQHNLRIPLPIDKPDPTIY